jgi:carbonic anhydrase/acetyltransferase-like protein (isoleucine patch superfamily)
MPLYTYREFKPKIGQGAYIAPSADVIGRVELGDNANVWHQTVVRGDVNKIVIGANTNVQDLSILHVTEKNPLLIGSGVSIAHHVTLHACTIGNHCLIGMGAIVLDGATIGEGSVVAAGSVVPPGKTYPPNSMIMGSPAKVMRELTEQERNQYHNHYKSYLNYKEQYLDQDLVKMIES